jgi:hypothetical protein
MHFHAMQTHGALLAGTITAHAALTGRICSHAFGMGRPHFAVALLTAVAIASAFTPCWCAPVNVWKNAALRTARAAAVAMDVDGVEVASVDATTDANGYNVARLGASTKPGGVASPLHATITVVFFAHLMVNWELYVQGYLTNLTAAQLAAGADLVRSIVPSALVDTHVGNRWEYPGMNLTWHYSLQEPSREHYIFYFHAKGIKRRRPEPQLFDAVGSNWRGIVRTLAAHPGVNKVGYLASDAGFMWFNFWWARGSYIARHCTKPKQPGRTVDRHYFMGWIALSSCDRVDDTGNAVEPTTGNRLGCYYPESLADCWDTATNAWSTGTIHFNAMQTHGALLAGTTTAALN